MLIPVDTEELDALDTLHYSPIDVEVDVRSTLCPIVQDQLLCLADIEGEVVVLTDHLSIGGFIAVGYQAYHRCVISKLNGVGIVRGHAVVGEQGVQEGTEHAPLGSSSFEDQRDRCVATYPHYLGAARQ